MPDVYADVIIDISARRLDRSFQYRVPEALRGEVETGSVVEIPFGAGDRAVRGYVTGISGEPLVAPEKIKDISKVLTGGGDADANLVWLAGWMRRRYGSSMSQALRTVFPVKRKVTARQERYLLPAADEETLRQALGELTRKHAAARARVLDAVIRDGKLPWSLAADRLNMTAKVAAALEKAGLVRIVTGDPDGEKAQTPGDDRRVELNAGQRHALEVISAGWAEDPPGRYLLHGVTGSGKTEVYMALAEACIARGRQAIVLIPEIALTYQTVMRFSRRFGNGVAVMNSRLSEGERYAHMERARRGEVKVMVGPRSALFAPFPDLGLIVVDEEHEPAYESETSPRYSAREVAFARGEREKALVVLGSATPSVKAYHMAKHGALKLVTLPERAGGAAMPEVSIVDMRRELREGNRSIISRRLYDELSLVLKQGRQAMLFINRRGYAGFLCCRSCGKVITCPHCDVSMTQHRDGRLVCHYCGHTQGPVRACPFCGSAHIGTFRAGTEQIEEEVQRLFPQARTLRMDLDSTRGKEGHARILSAFAEHEADILIGTQMIVKGHDFPDVTLMGILAADLSLHVADYRAAERTFQLLTQAAGRAGRADAPGRVVIQTYDPEHYAVTAAAAQDYEAFYEEELTYREMGGYPPAGTLTAIHVSCPDRELLEKACGYLAMFIREKIPCRGLTVLGPTDEAVAKIQDIYRKVIYIKHADRAAMTAVIGMIGRYIDANEGFAPLTVTVEAD